MTGITDEVRLPWGPYGERYTEYHDPLLTFDIENPEVVETTESGWPTVVVGETDGTKTGVAIEHVTQLNEKPAEEIDVFIDIDRNWWALVEFEDLEAAKTGGHYGVQGYSGTEVLARDRATEGFALFRDFAERKVTPLFETPDDVAAFAIQRATNFGTLVSMFRLSEYSHIESRQQSLRRQVLSRDEFVEENPLSDIARDVTEDDKG